MNWTAEELIDKISLKYDPDDFIDMLNLSTEQLATAFIDLVIENEYKFELEEYNEDSEED
tara:strand:- start:546 stop:725 length:180 start_codon:yes stop_codon:yes gene_type:complete